MIPEKLGTYAGDSLHNPENGHWLADVLHEELCREIVHRYNGYASQQVLIEKLVEDVEKVMNQCTLAWVVKSLGAALAAAKEKK